LHGDAAGGDGEQIAEADELCRIGGNLERKVADGVAEIGRPQQGETEGNIGEGNAHGAAGVGRIGVVDTTVVVAVDPVGTANAGERVNVGRADRNDIDLLGGAERIRGLDRGAFLEGEAAAQVNEFRHAEGGVGHGDAQHGGGEIDQNR